MYRYKIIEIFIKKKYCSNKSWGGETIVARRVNLKLRIKKKKKKAERVSLRFYSKHLPTLSLFRLVSNRRTKGGEKKEKRRKFFFQSRKNPI